MDEHADNKERSDSVTIYQGLLFQRVFKGSKGGLTVVIDIGDGPMFEAANVIVHNGYVLDGLPGGLTVANIGKIIGSMTTEQLIDATERGMKNNLPLAPSFIDYLKQASRRGQRVLIRHK